jgi:hypothetical protein
MGGEKPEGLVHTTAQGRAKRRPGKRRPSLPRTLKRFNIERFRREKGEVLPAEEALNGEAEICCALSGYGE